MWVVLQDCPGEFVTAFLPIWIMMWDGMNIDQISKLNFPIFRLWCKLTHRLSYPIRYVCNNSQWSTEVFKTHWNVQKYLHRCYHQTPPLTPSSPHFKTTTKFIPRELVGVYVGAWLCVFCLFVCFFFPSHMYLRSVEEMCLYTWWAQAHCPKDG